MDALNFEPRQELKYYLARADALLVRQRLKALMTQDRNAAPGRSTYEIRSLYFDSVDDRCLAEKLDGLDMRSKYRVRIYNGTLEPMRFEVKLRAGKSIYKEVLRIDADILACFSNGDFSPLLASTKPVLRRAAAEMMAGGFTPRVIVEYDREAYTLPFEQVRVTIDLGLRTYNSETRLCSPETSPIRVLPPDIEVVEIKYNRFLPRFIARALSAIPADHAAISKYVLCRRFFNRSS